MVNNNEDQRMSAMGKAVFQQFIFYVVNLTVKINLVPS